MSDTQAIIEAVGRICDMFDDGYWLACDGTTSSPKRS